MARWGCRPGRAGPVRVQQVELGEPEGVCRAGVPVHVVVQVDGQHR